jgi:hypothetical protein
MKWYNDSVCWKFWFWACSFYYEKWDLHQTTNHPNPNQRSLTLKGIWRVVCNNVWWWWTVYSKEWIGLVFLGLGSGGKLARTLCTYFGIHFNYSQQSTTENRRYTSLWHEKTIYYVWWRCWEGIYVFLGVQDTVAWDSDIATTICCCNGSIDGENISNN